MSTDGFLRAQAAVLDRYGFASEQRFVDVPSGGGRAHLLVAGEGPPVVMVNGIGNPAAMWAPLMARLDGYTLLAVDLPGYGLTDTIPAHTGDLRSTAVTFLRELLDGLGMPHGSFVANSLGSLWTSWLAIDEPQRVDRLVHVGCPALALGTSAPLPMRLLSLRGLGPLLMKLDPPSPAQVRRLSKMVNEHPLPTEIAELLVAAERLPAFQQTMLSTLRTLVRPRGARPEMTLTADHLSHIEHPSLFIFGADDPFGGPEIGERVAHALPNAQLEIVDGGHAPWLHHADQIAPLITDFLAGPTNL